MQVPKPIARRIKSVGRRAPQPVKAFSKKLLGPLLKSSSTSESKQPISGYDKTFGVTAEVLGDTYDPESLLAMLALENEALRKQLFAALDKQDVGVPETDPSAADETPNNDYEVALANTDHFLSLQGDVRDKPRHLVIANNYPRTGSEYANGFIHRRVLHYQQQGAHVDVLIAGYSADQEIFEYEGIRVLAGNGPEIDTLLKKQVYDSVSVHFLNPRMWEYIEPHISNISLHVFVHGYETSHWIRRIMNIPNGTSLERSIDRTISQQRHWQNVVNHPVGPTSFIFVSDWLHRAASQDMRVHFPRSRTQIVHNIIDTDLFPYFEKDPSQRFKILWIRSAHNLNYGHDIAIKTIQSLSRNPLWENIEIKIVGDGSYFSDFTKELGTFPNVTIEQGFISQSEISKLHKDYGIFLVPSRLDTQGVSRDEAMSSGLVPVTNSVAAIPEFVSESEAVLAPEEDAQALADGILRLMKNPNLFSQMSRAAANRVRSQSSPERTVDREMKILGIDPSTRESGE
ncbi:MAG: glycosyltransferase family 4 protein [Gulosibacter sp.]|uniref:glycosyltransferase family 4 protein n=1 Tax=Gulosibacter sp. TaxID=2817531 RepID=UPI003F8E553E